MSRRLARILSACGVGLLALAMVVILGWAIIGKHRLDDHARHVYRATRIIASGLRDAVPVPPPVPLIVCAAPPDGACEAVVATAPPRARGPAHVARPPSRSPPAA